MRRIVTAISAGALALSLVAQAAPASADSTAGYSSSYAGESAFLTLERGATGTNVVFFANTGTTTWTIGTSTQVDLLSCLEDKVTCDAQDASETPFNSGWLSATRYTTHTQSTVAPGQIGTFQYSVAVPAGQAAGTYRFNGDLAVSATGVHVRPEGYFQDVTVPAIAAVAAITVTPATDINQTGTTHVVTATYLDASGNAVANAAIDFFVVNDTTSPYTAAGACNRDSSATPNATGTACTIDNGDPITNTSGVAQFSYTSAVKETHRIVAWTGTLAAVFNSGTGTGVATATPWGSGTKTWIGAVAALDASPETKINPYATLQTITGALEDSAGVAVPLAAQTIRIEIYRGGAATETAADQTNGCTGTMVTLTSTTTDAAGAFSYSYTGPSDPSTATGTTTQDCSFVWWDQDSDLLRESGDRSDTLDTLWSDATAVGTTLTLTASDAGNAQSTSHSVTAKLVDQFGNGISGATIRFQVSRTGATAAVQTWGVIHSTTAAVRTTGSDGTAAFGYVGPALSADDTIDACYDKLADSVNCDGTGDIALSASPAAVTAHWATAAITGNTKASGSLVDFCDKASDTIYVSDSDGTDLLRYVYTSSDQFTVAGTPSTMAAFETACTEPDTIAITTYTTTAVSVFALTNN